MKKKIILGLIISINIYCSEPYTPESDYTKTCFKNGKIKKEENVLDRLRSVRFKLEESVKYKLEKSIRLRQIKKNKLEELKKLRQKKEEVLKESIEYLKNEDLKKEYLEKEAYYQRLLDDTKTIIINDKISFLDRYNKKHRQTW